MHLFFFLLEQLKLVIGKIGIFRLVFRVFFHLFLDKKALEFFNFPWEKSLGIFRIFTGEFLPWNF